MVRSHPSPPWSLYITSLRRSGQILTSPDQAVCQWLPASLSGSRESRSLAGRVASRLQTVGRELRAFPTVLAGEEAGVGPERFLSSLQM